MKSSIYNTFVPTKDKNFFIAYNTLSGSISLVDRDLKNALQTGQMPTNPKLRTDLLKSNLLVEDGVDEKKIYQYTHNKYKHDNNYLHFCLILSYDCNFRCPYCYQGSNKSKIAISHETMQNVLSFFQKTCEERKAKDLEITLYGGEPFLFPEKCREIVQKTSDWASDDQRVGRAKVFRATLADISPLQARED